MLRPFLIIIALAGVSLPACAQRSGPMPANCSGVFRATVESGRPHPRLFACTEEIVPQIVEVVADTRRGADSRYLARVITNASAYRDPAIARAALTIAQDRSAPAPAQMLGWVLATSQLRRGMYLRSLGHPVEQWFTTSPVRCDWADPTDMDFFRDNGLPPGFEDELARAAQSVAADVGRARNVRDYARCVAMLLPYSVANDSTEN
jgi:hypothetical protein